MGSVGSYIVLMGHCVVVMMNALLLVVQGAHDGFFSSSCGGSELGCQDRPHDQP